MTVPQTQYINMKEKWLLEISKYDNPKIVLLYCVILRGILVSNSVLVLCDVL